MRRARLWGSIVLFSVVGCVNATPDPVPVVAEASTGGQPAPPAGQSGDASQCFQDSYDAEVLAKYDVALAALDRLPPNYRTGYVATLRRGWLLSQLGRYKEAVEAYRAAATLEPKSVEAQIGEIVGLAALGRFADVEAVARDLLKRDPANHVANIRLAFALYSQGHFAEAETSYRTVLALYPSDVDAMAGLGWCRFKRGLRAEAAALFADTLAIAPKSKPALEGARVTAGGK